MTHANSVALIGQRSRSSRSLFPGRSTIGDLFRELRSRSFADLSQIFAAPLRPIKSQIKALRSPISHLEALSIRFLSHRKRPPTFKETSSSDAECSFDHTAGAHSLVTVINEISLIIRIASSVSSKNIRPIRPLRFTEKLPSWTFLSWIRFSEQNSLNRIFLNFKTWRFMRDDLH